MIKHVKSGRWGRGAWSPEGAAPTRDRTPASKPHRIVKAHLHSGIGTQACQVRQKVPLNQSRHVSLHVHTCVLVMPVVLIMVAALVRM